MIRRNIKTEDATGDEFFLWRSLKDGEMQGLEGLYRNFSKDLFIYGMAVHSDEGLVKDCIQELFIDLWKYKNTIRETSNVKIYLCKSLSNRIFRELHLENRRKNPNFFEIEQSLYETMQDETQVEVSGFTSKRLQTALDTLPKQQKLIIQYIFFDKFSKEEISAKMGIAVQSVYTLTWKAVGKLKKLLITVSCMWFSEVIFLSF